MLPPLADVRGGDDRGAPVEEAKYVEEELGGQPVDQLQLALQDVDLLQDTIKEEGANSGAREREGEGVDNTADTSWLLGLSWELEHDLESQ